LKDTLVEVMQVP